MKKKFSIGSLFDSRKFLIGFSIVLAILAWISVAMTTSQTIEVTVRDVPVNLELQRDALEDVDLSVLEGADQTVNVTVRGQRTVVGQLTPDDLSITARVTGITEPGPYDLTLTSAISTNEYEIVRYAPNTIRVRLDQLVTNTFDIDAMVQGISTPPDYMWDAERVTPQSVSITGPQNELDKIDRVVVSVDLEEPLTHTYANMVPITLLDAEGNAIDPDVHFLTLDVDEAQLVIPVYRVQELTLEVGFTNVPMGFPTDELRDYMQMSHEYIQVAGPVSMMDNYSQLRLGYIDLKTLTVENNTFEFEVTLPNENFTNMNDVNTVTVTFDTESWDSAYFNLSDIEMLNEPSNFEVTLLSNTISGVLFIGDEDVIAELTADDIVAEIDLTDRELREGQSLYPVKIYVPTKGFVWAVGDHSVPIQVREPE